MSTHWSFLQHTATLAPRVHITRDTFNVADIGAVIGFLRSMYNFKDEVINADALWVTGKEELCAELFETVAKLPLLSAQVPKSSGPAQSTSMPGGVTSISEYQHNLNQSGYYIFELLSTVCHNDMLTSSQY